MQTNHQVIKFYRPWATLPNYQTLPEVTKPLQTPPNEPYANEYTEADLRGLALENLADALPGLTITPASIQALPADFFLTHYLHVRYRRTLPTKYFPLRADGVDRVAFSTSAHALGGLVCMALTLKALLNQTALSIDAAKLREARNLALLLRELQFAIRETIKKYPLGTGPDNLIIGAFTQYDRVGESVSTVYTVLFDEDQLASWTSGNRTVQQAIDHWVANKTQPSW